ncbi:MAG TPA: histidine kinase dimerization/phospho-acceptor domain-containing protein, partial [Candidatus Dormibacteraeota bacterium]|nr:histidine kinase dimerization/phospho-acceptor domain-containing protein [Candidatus Dormibacteraeota bacterium]
MGGSLLFSLLALLLLPDHLVLSWVVPVGNAASIVCYAVVARLGAVDARLRSDSAALPAAVIGAALSVTWLAHLLVFPGTLPPLTGVEKVKDISSWLCLAPPFATPFLLALAALHVPRPLADGWRWARAALGMGLALGLGLVGLAALLGAVPKDGGLDEDAFVLGNHVVGLIGLVPVTATGVLLVRLFLSGHRCDDRVLRGVVPALALSSVNSLLLLWMTAIYSPVWYAIQVLSVSIAIALLFGQVNLYSRSVRAELRAIGRLEGSFRTAEALTSSLQPAVVIDQLLEYGMAAVEADRALLCRVEDDTILLEGCRAQDPVPNPGETYPLSSAPIVQAAARQRRIQVGSGPVAPTWLSVVRGHRVGPSIHAVAVPLVCAQELVGVLVVARVRDVPFGPGDLAAVGTIATVAALALRNARQFASVEEVSRAKSLFLNMAAHELRTPLSVVRGYASMLRDGTLGELSGECT